MPIVSVKKDFMDKIVNYFCAAKPREFFKTLNNLVFWNKHFTGIENAPIKASLGMFPKVFDAFNLLDLLDNVNNVRNHFNGRKISKDLSSLTSDTINSVAETTAWFSVAGILSLSAHTMSYVTSASGVTLMFSFSKNVVQNLSDLRKPANIDPNKAKLERQHTLWRLMKNISLFAIGLILFTCAWFGYVMSGSLLSLCSTAAVISEFKAYHLDLAIKQYQRNLPVFERLKLKFAPQKAATASA